MNYKKKIHHSEAYFVLYTTCNIRALKYKNLKVTLPVYFLYKDIVQNLHKVEIFLFFPILNNILG